jgi:hypothetical protein
MFTIAPVHQKSDLQFFLFLIALVPLTVGFREFPETSSQRLGSHLV